ncbi:MAG: Xaa-Pro aminopeptidase [bacterium]|nr:Xaa-Pro aminopeptidase [bacterium]
MRYQPFPPKFFAANRHQLALKLDEDSLALVFSSDPMVRNADQQHPWRQDSNFFYLTGLEQPGLKLLLFPQKNGQHQEILFIPAVDPTKEKWEGKMLTPERATEISGIKKVLASDQFLGQFYRLQDLCQTLYTDLNSIFPQQPLTTGHLLLDDLRQRLPGLTQKKLLPLILPLRAKKRPEEIEKLRSALKVMCVALKEVAGKIKPGVMEYQIEAELAYRYLYGGCSRLGFDTIVAGGQNACTLHYVSNDAALKNGDLVLIDTGAEYGMYSGDITRTFPVSGKFSERQKHCYQAVLEVNKQVIRKLHANLSWKEITDMAGKVQGEVYKKFGFIEDPKDYLKVGYHRIGHSLGLDVHDLQVPEWPLREGAVITVEPGLYLPDEGIGIRIEDNVLLTEGGCEVLSKEIPKEIDQLEALVGKG